MRIYLYTSDKIESVLEMEADTGELIFPESWDKFVGTEEEAAVFFQSLGIPMISDDEEQNESVEPDSF